MFVGRVFACYSITFCRARELDLDEECSTPLLSYSSRRANVESRRRATHDKPLFTAVLVLMLRFGHKRTISLFAIVQ